jgi:hypothetical protein
MNKSPIFFLVEAGTKEGGPTGNITLFIPRITKDLQCRTALLLLPRNMYSTVYAGWKTLRL